MKVRGWHKTSTRRVTAYESTIIRTTRTVYPGCIDMPPTMELAVVRGDGRKVTLSMSVEEVLELERTCRLFRQWAGIDQEHEIAEIEIVGTGTRVFAP